MSLSESLLQSQIALNQNTVAHLHWLVQDCHESMQCHVEEYKYYAGLHPDKERIKKIKAAYFMQANALKREIAKYAKLQKALKAELKGVRQQKAMVRAFLNKKSNTGDIQLCGKESQVFWGNILREGVGKE